MGNIWGGIVKGLTDVEQSVVNAGKQIASAEGDRVTRAISGTAGAITSDLQNVANAVKSGGHTTSLAVRSSSPTTPAAQNWGIFALVLIAAVMIFAVAE